MVFRFNLTFVFALGWAAAACGQITLHQVELSGSIVQVAPQAIAIKAANGQNWTLKLRNGTKIKVTGSAEPEMLTAGTCVRFTARIDKRTSKGQDKIGNITIFTPTPGVAERTLGVERASAHPQGQDDAHAAGPRRGPGMGPPGPVPGAGPDPGPPADPGLPDEATDGGKAPKKRGPAAKGPDKSVPEVADYDVCAQVVSFRGGRLIVSVPNSFFKPKVTVELAADAQIGLDLGDPSVVKPGDKLSAVGFFIKPGFCDVVESVEVALANPLAPPGRSHRPRPAVHAGDTAHQSGSKAKPGAEPAAGKKAVAAGPATTEKATGKKPEAEAPTIDDLEKDNPPAKTASGTKPEPVPTIDLAPPAEEVKPEPKKPAEKPAKKPPVKDDEKDVFEK